MKFVPGFLTNMYNNFMQQQRDARAFKADVAVLKDAIRAADADKVAEVFAKIGDKLTARRETYDETLQLAINSNNVAIFDTVLGDSDINRDIASSHWAGPGAPSYLHVNSLLSYALKDDSCPAVALRIAKDPAIDPYKSGYDQTIYFNTNVMLSSGAAQTVRQEKPAPLQLACDLGLLDVAEHISLRIATMAAGLAQNLKAQALSK